MRKRVDHLYTPLSSGSFSSGISQSMASPAAHTKLPRSISCPEIPNKSEITFASALHLKLQPHALCECLGLINYSKTPLQPEVLPHSALPGASAKGL
eukprot:scaffold10977_cov82-Skeletonema_dohrnii-CCMP3373.AAC.3